MGQWMRPAVAGLGLVCLIGLAAGGDQGRSRRSGGGPAATRPASRERLSDAAFEDLARQVVDLYRKNAEIWRNDALDQGEKQRRSRAIMTQVSALYKQVSRSGRSLAQSAAYKAWQEDQRQAAATRRLRQLRRQLNVENDAEWTVLERKINVVLQLRNELGRAENRTRPWSPADKLAALRAETKKTDPDEKRVKTLLDTIRAAREQARQEAEALRTKLNAAQTKLVSLLTIEQEAVLVLNQVVY